MSDDASKPTLIRRLFSRPRNVIEAEQKRHDRALARALTGFFCALVLGGGLAAFVEFGPFFRDLHNMQAVLECLVFVAPLSASLVVLGRVPPPPFEAFSDRNLEIDRNQMRWRAALLMQIFTFGLLAAQAFWLWPRFGHLHGWLALLPSTVPMLCIVILAIAALYLRPGWSCADLRLVLDDEVTRSFRARAQRLGYLLLLFILLALGVLARINPQAAAQCIPLALAVGAILPILYFVYLDWQASRSG
jgi:hypothetical protein